MNKVASLIIVLGFIGGLFLLGGVQNGANPGSSEPGKNVEIRDGIQYITINAGGGYAPKVSAAKAGIPTKLIVKTDGTYDCSSSLVIRSLDYQKILSQTGEEVIDVGVPVAGTPLKGTCGMGMYSFAVNFN